MALAKVCSCKYLYFYISTKISKFLLEICFSFQPFCEEGHYVLKISLDSCRFHDSLTSFSPVVLTGARYQKENHLEIGLFGQKQNMNICNNEVVFVIMKLFCNNEVVFVIMKLFCDNEVVL